MFSQVTIFSILLLSSINTDESPSVSNSYSSPTTHHENIELESAIVGMSAAVSGACCGGVPAFCSSCLLSGCLFSPIGWMLGIIGPLPGALISTAVVSGLESDLMLWPTLVTAGVSAVLGVGTIIVWSAIGTYVALTTLSIQDPNNISTEEANRIVMLALAEGSAVLFSVVLISVLSGVATGFTYYLMATEPEKEEVIFEQP